MLFSRSVKFLRLVLPRDLAVCATSRTLLSKPKIIVPRNVSNYSKLSPSCFKDIVFAIEMAPRKAAKAAKAVKVEEKQPEDLPLPKNGNKDSDEEAVVDPVEVKKPRVAGKKGKAAVNAKDDDESTNIDAEEKISGKKEVASENGNGVQVEEMAEEEEVEEKEGKAKRGARKPKGKVEEKKPTKRGRGKAVEDVVEAEEDEEEQPAPKRGKKAKAVSSKKVPKKGTKASKKDEEEKAEESENLAEEDKEEKQEEQPKKGRNAKAVKEDTKASKMEEAEKGDESDLSDEEKKEEKQPAMKKGRKAKAASSKKSSIVTSTEQDAEVGQESDHSVEEKKKEEEQEQPATKRGRKAKATSSKKSSKMLEEEDAEDGEESDQSGEPAKKAPAKRGKKRGAVAKKDDDNEKTGPSKKAKANPTVTDWDSISFDCTRENSMGKTPNFRITSWNVDGIRAWINKGGLEVLKKANPDILCLQETKCSVEKLPEEIQNVEGYKAYWCASDKEGYAGVGILTKMMPIDVFYGIESEEQDLEGRCITAEFKKFYLVNVYVPNAGRKLVTLPKRLEWNEAFKSYVKKLDEKKPVIICGDLNVAHNEIDLANPKSNKKNAGFTQEERDGMTDFLSTGFVDTFRKLYPDKEKAYTFWTYMMNARAKDAGWRLDYFLLSERFVKDMCDNVIHSKALGSDHCPITLYMNI